MSEAQHEWQKKGLRGNIMTPVDTRFNNEKGWKEVLTQPYDKPPLVLHSPEY
jgi:hypothetical protein